MLHKAIAMELAHLVLIKDLVLQVLVLSKPGRSAHLILRWHATMDLNSVLSQDQLSP
jgi:hypothetical protein